MLKSIKIENNCNNNSQYLKFQIGMSLQDKIKINTFLFRQVSQFKRMYLKETVDCFMIEILNDNR